MRWSNTFVFKNDFLRCKKLLLKFIVSVTPCVFSASAVLDELMNVSWCLESVVQHMKMKVGLNF